MGSSDEADIMGDEVDEDCMGSTTPSSDDGDALHQHEDAEMTGGCNNPRSNSDADLFVDDANSSGEDLLFGSDDDHTPERGGGVSPQRVGGGMSPRPHLPFHWAFVVMKALESSLTAETIRTSLLFSAPTLTTHFSGVGTVEQAARFLKSASSIVMGMPVDLQFISACECRAANQAALKSVISARSCLFSDILAMSRTGARVFADATRRRGSIGFSDMWECLQRDGLRLDSSPCVQHRGCQCKTPRPIVDFSGSPCQPWSRIGKRQGRRSPLQILFMVFCLWVRATKPLILVHENVIGFDVGMLKELLGDLYAMDMLDVSPAHAGFSFLRRRRLYAVLRLRGATTLLRPIPETYAAVRQAISRNIPPQPLSYCFVACQADILGEENAARARRGLAPRRDRRTVGWEYLLTVHQKRRLREYCSAFVEREGREPSTELTCLFNLTQNPRARPNQTTRAGEMPTITRQSKLLWSPSMRRWLLPVELAAASGLPVTSAFAADARVPMDTFAGQYTPSQIGNIMHLANAGSVLAVALACSAAAR